MGRPLDFLVISDHGEGLGLMAQVYEGNPAFLVDDTVARWSKMMRAGGEEGAKAANEIVAAQAANKMPAIAKDPKVVGPVMASVWKQYTATAEKYNEPGRFTAMIGYEWTSVPNGNNLHRNVLFRDGKDKADQIFPFLLVEQRQPGEALGVDGEPTNRRPAASCWPSRTTGTSPTAACTSSPPSAGGPLTREYAQQRQRWEPLQEIIQTKGASETNPLIAPNDEFAETSAPPAGSTATSRSRAGR
jgi:hypothetical protein